MLRVGRPNIPGMVKPYSPFRAESPTYQIRLDPGQIRDGRGPAGWAGDGTARGTARADGPTRRTCPRGARAAIRLLPGRSGTAGGRLPDVSAAGTVQPVRPRPPGAVPARGTVGNASRFPGPGGGNPPVPDADRGGGEPRVPATDREAEVQGFQVRTGSQRSVGSRHGPGRVAAPFRSVPFPGIDAETESAQDSRSRLRRWTEGGTTGHRRRDRGAFRARVRGTRRVLRAPAFR
jgi:hypothetical protein